MGGTACFVPIMPSCTVHWTLDRRTYNSSPAQYVYYIIYIQHGDYLRGPGCGKGNCMELGVFSEVKCFCRGFLCFPVEHHNAFDDAINTSYCTQTTLYNSLHNGMSDKRVYVWFLGTMGGKIVTYNIISKFNHIIIMLINHKSTARSAK